MTEPVFIDEAARQRIHHELDATLFVEAGAGTGKTRELIGRLIRLVASGTAELRTIAAITFTESAAAELRDRVRLELEQAARDDSGRPQDERERCGAAVAQLDAAAIETLHAFAQRILSDHAVEAGLPPIIEIQDEIQASIAFEERWTPFIDELLADASMEKTLLQAFALGLELKDLREVAQKLHENWDRLEDVSITPAPIPPVDSSSVISQLEEALALRSRCNDHADKLYEHLDSVDAYRQRLVACETDLDRLRVMAERTRLSAGRKGKKGNWDAITLDAIRDPLACAQERRDGTMRAVRTAVLSAMLSSLRAFTLAYAGERRGSGRLEFHDLLVQARDLLRQNAEVRRRVSERFTHLLIDEFQDTDPLQIEIATLIASGIDGEPRPWEDAIGAPGRLFFVGDPKQSIYRFRRADIELYLRTQERYPSGIVRLTKNFRAVQPVIQWTNRIFSSLMDATHEGQARYVELTPARPAPEAGITVRIVGGPGEENLDAIRRQEARELAALIRSVKAQPWMVESADGNIVRAASYRDIAILIPTRTPLPPIEEALESAGIPYRVESRSLIYGTQEVRDLLSVLRAIDDPTDEVALIAALRSPAFACSDDDLLGFRQANGRWDYRATPPIGGPVANALGPLRSFHQRRWWMPISQLVETVIRERRLFELAFAHRRPRERWQRLRLVLDQARAFAEAGGRTLRQFIDWAERQASEGTRVIETVVPEPDDDAVRIMTIHAAKGLEFPIVILAGLNVPARHQPDCALWGPDGSIEARLGGNGQSFESDGYQQLKEREKEMEQAEKARLLYVAATRARDHLVVSLYHRRDQKCPASVLYPLCMEARDLWQPIDAESVAPTQAAAERTVFADSLECREAWERERNERLETLSRIPALAATEIARRAAAAKEDPNLQKDRPSAEAPPWKRGRAGTAFGRAVHAVLQTIDLDAGGDIDRVARAQAAAEGIPRRAPEIARATAAALEAPAIREAIAGGRYWRELYVAAPVEGVTLEGFIDLLYETPEGLVIVDYKTDAVPEDSGLDEALGRYRLQGAAYALALQESLGRPVARCVFVFTRPSGARERELPDLPAAIDEVREVLRQPVPPRLGAERLLPADGDGTALRPLDEVDQHRVDQLRLF